MNTKIIYALLLLQVGHNLCEEIEERKHAAGKRRNGKYLNWFSAWPYESQATYSFQVPESDVDLFGNGNNPYHGYRKSYISDGYNFGQPSAVVNGIFTGSQSQSLPKPFPGFQPVGNAFLPIHSGMYQGFGYPSQSVQSNSYHPYPFNVPLPGSFNSPLNGNFLDNQVPDVTFLYPENPAFWKPVSTQNQVPPFNLPINFGMVINGLQEGQHQTSNGGAVSVQNPNINPSSEQNQTGSGSSSGIMFPSEAPPPQQAGPIEPEPQVETSSSTTAQSLTESTTRPPPSVESTTMSSTDAIIDPNLLALDSSTFLANIEVPIKCTQKDKLQIGIRDFLRNLTEKVQIIFNESNCGSGFSSVTGTIKSILRLKDEKPEEYFLKVKASCYFGCEIANETLYFTDFVFTDSTEVKSLLELPENMACGTRRTDVARIVNGENARDGQYPWMAAIFIHYYDPYNSKYVLYYCGGSIISPRHIITAAHCLSSIEQHANVFVHVGDVELPFNNVTLLIDEVLGDDSMNRSNEQNLNENDLEKSSLESLQRILKFLSDPALAKQPQMLIFIEDILKGTLGRHRQARKDEEADTSVEEKLETIKGLLQTPLVLREPKLLKTVERLLAGKSRTDRQARNEGKKEKSLKETSGLIQKRIRENFPGFIFAENALVHHEFNSDNDRAENDLAIIKLEKPLVFDDAVRPICVAPSNLRPEGRAGVITGWGRTSEADGDTRLQVAGLPIWKLDECQEKYPPSSINVTNKNVCAGGINKPIAACRGDSGGPLLYQLRDGRWSVAGVVSFAGNETCDDLAPTVFARVSSYVSWIRESIDTKTF